MPPASKKRKGKSKAPTSKRTRESTGKSRRSRSLTGASFIEREAGEGGSPQRDDDDEEQEEEERQSDRDFIDNHSSQRQNSPVSHMALDNTRRDQEGPSTSRDVGPVMLSRYFPLGLARSAEEPTDFNFTLFLYDSLQLPHGLFPDDADEDVEFENLQQCRQYCMRYVAAREGWCKKQNLAPDETQQRRSELSKDTMFYRAGHPLGNKTTTGNALFDSHLEDLRLDVFGNVMFLKAPHWSDISPQFMHGFPRRLITQSHRGILPGNITVAARISNQAIRSLSTGDIAAFISQRMVEGLGLTMAELMLARSSAIKYVGKQDKPARLIDLMLRFGMDFLTITPLSKEQLENLRIACNTHLRHVLATPPQEEDAESSSSSDSELTVDWDTAAEIEAMPEEGTDEYTDAVREHVDNMVCCYVSRHTETVELEVRAETVKRKPSGSSGRDRRRKQTSPRRVAASRPTASQGSSAPATSDQSQMDEEHEQQTPTAPANPREDLLALPGIQATRIPNEDSLNRLKQFLRDNQPCDPQQAEQVTAQATESLAQARQAAARRNYQQLRNQKVEERVRNVWTASREECMCIGEPVARSSQGDTDQECPYCLNDNDGGVTATVTSRCRNEECTVCMMMNKLDKVTLTALGLKRNERLTAMLELAPSIAHCLNAGRIPEDRRQALVEAFCDLLSCGKTKLRYLANVGFLVMICPRLKHLHLEKGWGDVWCNLSKVASAIGYHDNNNSQLAALIFVRERCVPDRSSKWFWFLQSENPDEQRVYQEVFQRVQAADSATAQPKSP